jgi:hypothetical protein
MEEEIKKEIIGKMGFPLYVDYWDKYFSKMTGGQIKEVLDIIFNFNKTYEIKETNDLAVNMVITTIIDNIKRDASKRLRQSKASRENGKSGGRPSSKHTKPKITESEPKITKQVITYSDNVEQLANGLKFVLEAKLNKKLNSNSWKAEIKKLIDIDLKQRENPAEDVKRAIQAVADYTGEEYFPVIQSGGSLREKFTKIENFLAKRQNNKNITDKQIYQNLMPKYQNE